MPSGKVNVKPRTPTTVTPKKTSVVTKSASVVTPVASVVVAPLVTPVASVVTPLVTPVVTKTSVVALKSETPSPSVEAEVTEEKPKRQRPKNRPSAEIQEKLTTDLDVAYKLLQSCVKDLRALKAAHKREVAHSRNRESTVRTPTLCLDQVLIDYLRSRLDATDFTISRTVGNGDRVQIDLSGLDVNTHVHRTDVTQLYCKVFAKHNMKGGDGDGRKIMYQNDSELVKLLTSGVTNPAFEEDVTAIRNGTYGLNIFNIQKFTSQYIHKACGGAEGDQ